MKIQIDFEAEEIKGGPVTWQIDTTPKFAVSMIVQLLKMHREQINFEKEPSEESEGQAGNSKFPTGNASGRN